MIEEITTIRDIEHQQRDFPSTPGRQPSGPNNGAPADIDRHGHGFIDAACETIRLVILEGGDV